MWRQYAWLVALAAIVGCSGSERNLSAGGPADHASGSGKTLRIAVIPKASTHEFWKSVHAGAENAAKELGNVEILWKAPAHDDDRAEQINLVQDFVTRGVDGICLAPIDSQALIGVAEGSQTGRHPRRDFRQRFGRS